MVLSKLGLPKKPAPRIGRFLDSILQLSFLVEMQNSDEWLALDKVYHVLFCFSIAITASFLAANTRYSFIRRRSIWVGSVISFSAGAAKEIADELGFFMSSGASAKDAIADFIGIFLSVLVLRLSNYKPSPTRPSTSVHVRVVDMV